MKKIFMLLTAAVFAFAACEEKVSDVCADCGQNPCVCDEPSSALELHLDVNVQLQHEVNTNYSGTTATIDGEKVLEFFGFENTQQYYEAMGYLSGGGQVENTLMYGVCVKDGEEWIYTFNPSTSANIGHWFTREGVMTTWGSEEAPQYFFTESQQWMWNGDWRVEDPAADDDTWSYDLAWNYTVGMEPGYYDLTIGDKLSAVEFIFEESTGKTLYIHWNIEIVDYIPRPINALETVRTEVSVEYNNAFIPTALSYDYNAIATKLGVSDLFKECDMYPVYADGSYAKAADVRGWYDAEGNPNGYGDTAVMCLEQAGDPVSYLNIFCMPYNENLDTPQTAADKCGTFVCKMAFVAANDNAVILEVTATISEPKPWAGEIVETYTVTESYAYNANGTEWGAGYEASLDYAAIAEKLGVESLLDATSYPILEEGYGTAANDFYFANANGVESLNLYVVEGKTFVYTVPVPEGVAVADACGEVEGSFVWASGDKGVKVVVKATITEPAE